MSRTMKKFMAFLLSLMLVLSMTTVMAFADENTDTTGGEGTATNGEATTEGEGTDGATGDTSEGEATETTGGEAATEEAGSETTEASDEVTLTVLHTNDVHCGIDNYAKLAAYRDSLKEAGQNVVLIDAGDHVQGESIGTITKGEEIITIMNGVGYDVAIPGNHEFDFQMDQFQKNVSDANYPYISANFKKADGSAVENIEPYYIVEVEGKKVAFVGISTPETFTSSTPVYFQDEEGNWLYSFCADSEGNEGLFYSTIQAGIDAAKAAGADVVIGVGHTGMIASIDEWNSQNVIANTTGLDAYIDGHSHEVVPGPDYNGTTFTNKDGKAVPYSQTGTKLANVGQMTVKIKDGVVSVLTSLVAMDTLTDENEEVKSLIDAANQKVNEYLGEIVGKAEVTLTILDEEGNRIVRNHETNLGDFNADAFRYVTGADIAIVNSGGVRKSLEAGDVTRKSLTDVNPFGNEIIKIEATGQQILDALEHGARNYPQENGGFFQVSGLTYEVHEYIPSAVIVDEQNMFLGIEEGKERRVANVKINGEPIDPEKIYTVGGTSYILQLSGDGMSMFKDSKVVSDAYPNDSNSLVEYMKNGVKGLISAAQYGQVLGEGRVTFVTEAITPGDVVEPTDEQPAPTEPEVKPVTPAPAPAPAPASKPATAPAASGVPKTGDAENAVLYIALFAGAAVTAYAVRKRNAA